MNDVEQVLLQKLVAWRITRAAELKVSTFAIFDDDTLIKIVRDRPKTEFELQTINGISVERLELHGHLIMRVLYDVLWSGKKPPSRAFFSSCSSCGLRMALKNSHPIDEKQLCLKCERDPAIKIMEARSKLRVKLPRASDFD